MRNRQQQKQVLDKPNLHPEANKKSTSSKKPVVVVRDPDDFEDPAAVDVLPKMGGSGGSAVGASGQGLVAYDVRSSSFILEPTAGGIP